MRTLTALTAGFALTLSLAALTARPAAAQAAPPAPSIVSITETGPNSGTVTFSFPPDAVLEFPVTSRGVRVMIRAVLSGACGSRVEGRGA